MAISQSPKQPLLLLASVLFSALPLIAQQGAARAAADKPAAPEMKEMQQVEDRWDDAVTKHDQYGLELVLAPQLVDISATGDVTTRNQQIARLFVKGAEPMGLEQKVVNVRILGEVAVVSGTYVMHWRVDNRPVDEKGIFTHVFERTRTNWMCINSQRTVVADDMHTRQAEASRKPQRKSDAELPFHIPLVYKGPASTATTPAPNPDKDERPQN